MKNHIIGLSTIFLAAAAAVLPAMAQTPPPPGRVFGVVCIQNSVAKRDDAIIAAFDAYSSAVRAALVARRDAVKTAWTTDDPLQRRLQIQTAWSQFNAAWLQAKNGLQLARQGGWAAFRNTDRPACRR